MAHDLFLTLDFPPDRGGVARYYGALLNALPQRRVTVVAPWRPFADPYQPPPNVTIRRVRMLGPRWLWPRWLPLLWHSLRQVTRNRPALLHVGQVLPVGTVAMIIKRFFGVPYIVYAHGLDLLNARAQPRKRTLAQRVLRRAAAVIVNSGFTERVARELGGQSARILRVLPGCTLDPTAVSNSDRERFLDEQGTRGRKVVLTVARLVTRKGVLTALRAFARLLLDVPDALYIVVGDGPERQSLEQTLHELGLTASVRFVGAVSDVTLLRWFAVCDVFVLVPTALGGADAEGFGIVYLEAGAFGKPVVASRTGGVADAVQEGVTGLLVPPDDPVATADAIRRLLSDPALARRLGEQGRRVVQETATWNQRVQPLKTWLTSFAPDS